MSDVQQKILPRSKRKRMKKLKWQHAQEIEAEFEALGMSVFRFNSEFTPHIRIADCVDYWPATGRFYFLDSGLKGRGTEKLKELLKSNQS